MEQNRKYKRAKVKTSFKINLVFKREETGISLFWLSKNTFLENWQDCLIGHLFPESSPMAKIAGPQPYLKKKNFFLVCAVQEMRLENCSSLTALSSINE